MKTFVRVTLLVAVLLATGSAIHAQVSVGIVIGAPPPPRVVAVVPVRPGPEFVWVEGYWYPVGKRYRWHEGYWTRPPYEGARWVAPRHDGERYYAGYWEGERGRVEHDHHWDKHNDRDFHDHDRHGDHEHDHDHDR
jgi:WXXGXW repeat (2 copies)